MSRSALALVLIVFWASATPMFAAFYFVNDTADLIDVNPGNNVCATTAGTCTLRAAIQEANAHAGADDVFVPAGVFVLTLSGVDENGAASGDLDITSDIDIFGAGLGLTIVDGNQSDRVFHVIVGPAALYDMTVRGGLAADLANSGLGGGIYAAGGQLDIGRVELTGNVANAGGGLAVASGAVADIFDSIFSNNRAADLGLTNAYGGAVYSTGDTDITDTTIVGNRADAAGAGIFSSNSAIISFLSLRNSTLSGNLGTALLAQNTSVDLSNVTLYANGGWGLSYYSFDGATSLSVKNSILAANSPDCGLFGVPPTSLDFAGKHNLDSDGTCALDDMAGDLPLTDPQLGALLPSGGTSPVHVPRVGSPVIDAGDNGTCESDDQRGASRPLDGDGVGGATCDIGAVEVFPCTGIPDRIVQNDTVTTSENYVACFTLTGGPAFIVGASGDVTFRARDAIVLANGFTVADGATSFRAVLDPAAGSGIIFP